jgi:ankyrin repeat protein
MAACYGRDEVILILINAGADINCEDYLKNTALHYAAKNGHKKTV